MINKSQTFCKTRRIHGMCFECERHIRHEVNKKFKNNTVSEIYYEPIKTKTHGVHCDGWAVYPLKD